MFQKLTLKMVYLKKIMERDKCVSIKSNIIRIYRWSNDIYERKTTEVN